MVTLKVFEFGTLSREFVNYVISILKEFYNLVEDKAPLYVEVYIYEQSLDKFLVLEKEALELGVIAVGDFITLHEAWRGWPRIHIDFEKCADLHRDILRSLIIHEAAHSVLHASPIYYVVSIPLDILKDLPIEVAYRILYYASIAVKDLEVSQFLYSLNLKDELFNYSKFLEPYIKECMCSNIEDLLELAKLITPFITIGKDISPLLRIECRNIAQEIIRILMKCFKSYKDLDSRVYCLLSNTLSLFESRYRYYQPS